MVSWTIEAVYQNGVFRPLVPVGLPENACVTLVLHSDAIRGAAGPTTFGEMDESEMLWVGWAGSLGAIPSLAGTEHDEG